MNELTLFASTFGVVFCLGFQSLTVNAGHYKLAFFMSFLIGGFNLLLYKTAPHVTGWGETAAYLFGGPTAIVSAMYVHRHFVAKWLGEKNARPRGHQQERSTQGD